MQPGATSVLRNPNAKLSKPLQKRKPHDDISYYHGYFTHLAQGTTGGSKLMVRHLQNFRIEKM